MLQLGPGCLKEPPGKLMPSWEGITDAVLQLLSHLYPYHPQEQAKGHCSCAQSVGWRAHLAAISFPCVGFQKDQLLQHEAKEFQVKSGKV